MLILIVLSIVAMLALAAPAVDANAARSGLPAILAASDGPYTKCWQFVKAEGTPEGEPVKAELLFYGDIGDRKKLFSDTITPKQFAQDLRDLGPVDELTVRIHSYGGSLSAAQAIYNQLKEHSAKVTTFVDGAAHSAASIVAMAGDKVIMPENTMMMIHNPYLKDVSGDHRELRKYADVVENFRNSILPVYQMKTGLEAEQLISLLDDETWMNAAQARELGFADEVSAPVPVQALADDRYEVNGTVVNFGTSADVPPAFAAIARHGQVRAEVEGILARFGVELAEPYVEALANVWNAVPQDICAQVRSGLSKYAAEEAAADSVIMNLAPAMGKTEALSDMIAPAEESAAEPTAEAEAEPATEEASETEEPAPEPTAEDPVATERARIQAILALSTPGAEEVIRDAIASGAAPGDVAQDILKLPAVRNATTLSARKRDAPAAIAPETAPPPVGKQARTLGLASAMKKLRGL